MKRTEAAALAKQVAGLFQGQVNQAHRETMITTFQTRERREIEVAIANYHRGTRELDWDQFWAACEATRAAPESVPGASPQKIVKPFRLADEIRKRNQDWAIAGDVEVLVRHFQRMFDREKRAADANGRSHAVAAARHQRDCQAELVSLWTVPYEQTTVLAAAVVADPPEFQAALDDIRRNWPGTASDRAGAMAAAETADDMFSGQQR